MRFKRLNILPISCILVVLLSLGCKQKSTQNADNKQEIPPSGTGTGGNSTTQTGGGKNGTPNTGTDPFGAIVLKNAKSPTLIFGSNPAYLEVEKKDEEWSCKFVEDASLNDPGLVDQTFKLNSSGGVQFHKDPKANDHGLYFAELPIRTKINVCGTTECKLKDVNQLDLMVVRTTSQQFDDLQQKSQAFDAATSKEKTWSMYFFDENLQSFQSNLAAKVTFDKDKKIGVVDWNGALDKTGIVPLADESTLALKWIDLEKPVLVGKYKADDGKSYNILGIGQLHFEE